MLAASPEENNNMNITQGCISIACDPIERRKPDMNVQ